ncbi:hypothetical protein Rhe02_04210 [Rhizocola hellebori]|uniref:DUF1152 domain-containing protein n=1 Tax=Rhizocola hellebori TaxID=1392758 RepID=A0A8J3Q2B7_9ACTN|nr:DUF1152 domain-containing protein [Rhizocola hellebori]GIH02354.1 hypothetical protein Rhe02_04210 [Rhizocola hellebori]
MWRLPFFEALNDSQRVLIAGAGGGFDVYAGLPLGLSLMNAGKTVHWASLSIVNLYDLDKDAWLEPGVAAITDESTAGGDYFPERVLARWLARHSMPSTVYAFPRTGVRPLRSAYRRLAKRLDLDTIVLVDGGTDILMRGDEAALGTPVEDATSLAAVHGTPVPTKLVASIGFGIDAYHGINHVQVLENIAALDRAGAYLGAFTVPSHGREAALYRDAVAYAQACTPDRASIVNGQIAAALTGAAGDVRLDGRTDTTALFVNPLMAMYFTFDLAGLAAQSLYLQRIRQTETMLEVSHLIERFRDEVTPRPRVPFPH